MRLVLVWLITAGVVLPATALRAEPAAPPSDVLRAGNAAAAQGDWAHLAELVGPLFTYTLGASDLAEAHRLAGLAAFFQQRTGEAEAHFLAYLKIDLEGRLDPALYPPEVVGFFDDVRVRHAAELRRLRPTPRRSFLLALLPPVAQYQNGDRAKFYILGGAMVGFAVANITTYLVLRSWCNPTTGSCNDSKDHVNTAEQLRAVNVATGIGLILTTAYGVYDGVRGYRQKTRDQLYVSSSERGVFMGLMGGF